MPCTSWALHMTAIADRQPERGGTFCALRRNVTVARKTPWRLDVMRNVIWFASFWMISCDSPAFWENLNLRAIAVGPQYSATGAMRRLIKPASALRNLLIHCPANWVQSPYQYDSFASQLVEVYVNFNRSHLTISKRHLVTPWHRRSMIIFSSPSQPFFYQVLIFPIAPKAVYRICFDHIQLWAVVVCQLPSQTKLVIMSTNIRPVIIKIVFSSRIVGFLRGRCRELLERY